MNSIRLFAVLTLISAFARSAHGHEVTVAFQVNIPATLSPLSNVYISSSRNGWSPSSPVWKMRQNGPLSYRLDIRIPQGEKLEYHFTLGDPECLEAEEGGHSQPHRFFVAKEGLVRTDTVAEWTMQSVNVGRWLPADVYHFQDQWLRDRWSETPLESMDAANPLRNLRGVAQLDSVVEAAQEEWRNISETKYGGVAPNILSAYYFGLLRAPQENTMAPTLLSESKSSGRSRCSSVRQAPEGPPI